MIGYTQIRQYSSNLGVLNMKSENRLGRETRRSSAPSSRRPGRSTMPPYRGSSRRSRRGRVRVTPRKRSRNKATILLLSTLVVMLVLVVGGIAVKVINSESTPEADVREYVQLIADGKYDEANKVVDPGVTGAQRELLTNKAYSKVKGSVKFESISGLQYDEDDDSATVNVNLLVGGHPMEAELKVESYKNNFGLRKWKILTPLLVQVQIYRHAYLSSYKIGSAVVNMRSQNYYGSVSYMMYPGVYNVVPQSINPEYVKTVPTHNKFVAVVKSRTSTAAVGAPTYVNLNFDSYADAEPTDRLKQWALQQIQDKVKTCGSVIEAKRDHSCPLEVRGNDVESLEVKASPDKLKSIEYVEKNGLIEAKGDAVITVKYGVSSPAAGEAKDVEHTATASIAFDEQRQPKINWTGW